MTLNSVGDWIEYLFSDTAKFSIVVYNLVIGFEEIIKDNLFFVIKNRASGQLKASSGSDHLAIYNQN